MLVEILDSTRVIFKLKTQRQNIFSFIECTVRFFCNLYIHVLSLFLTVLHLTNLHSSAKSRTLTYDRRALFCPALILVI